MGRFWTNKFGAFSSVTKILYFKTFENIIMNLRKLCVDNIFYASVFIKVSLHIGITTSRSDSFLNFSSCAYVFSRPNISYNCDFLVSSLEYNSCKHCFGCFSYFHSKPNKFPDHVFSPPGCNWGSCRKHPGWGGGGNVQPRRRATHGGWSTIFSQFCILISRACLTVRFPEVRNRKQTESGLILMDLSDVLKHISQIQPTVVNHDVAVATLVTTAE